ncbi:hypothetical protein phiB5_10 [Propionibacterium phage B5]|uniref:Orf10 n=1 Tax=Propionibacterium phage B5 TaxID=189836 RepID=Q8SCH6_9VIRU|nr:hypothetical protein phiB5_10 [Propionibacterium phage B5]AAL91703.1 Orf10 [Propionibacterium phage B5]
MQALCREHFQLLPCRDRGQVAVRAAPAGSVDCCEYLKTEPGRPGRGLRSPDATRWGVTSTPAGVRGRPAARRVSLRRLEASYPGSFTRGAGVWLNLCQRWS